MDNPLFEKKFVLVVRKTRLDNLISRHNTKDQVKFVIESQGGNFSDYILEHENYYTARQQIEKTIQKYGRYQILDRVFLPNFIFGKDDIVVALGQDGLVANTMKYLDTQPLVGVNPDPDRWDGILLPFTLDTASNAVIRLCKGEYETKNVSMALASLKGGQSLLAVNDFFIGPKTHFSARYEISHNQVQEIHSSSGVIVSTGLGSTGWLSSILQGSQRINAYLTKNFDNINSLGAVPWDADYLYFTAREPFVTKISGAELSFGKITQKKPLVLKSLMPEGGVIFSDGIENDFIEFNAGTEVIISLSERKGKLVTK